MSVQAHIAQLEERHRSLDTQLDTLSGSPSVSDDELREIKRQKLQLKDRISKLQGETAH